MDVINKAIMEVKKEIFIPEILPARSLREIVRNKIIELPEIDEILVNAAKDGLSAMVDSRDDMGVPVSKPDYSVRYKYWRDICIMKKWLTKEGTDVNIGINNIQISSEDEKLLMELEAETKEEK